MENILYIAQIVISVILITLVLIQQKGSGLGVAFGGDGGSVQRTKRGAEKSIFNLTIIFATLFLLTALANIFI